MTYNSKSTIKINKQNKISPIPVNKHIGSISIPKATKIPMQKRKVEPIPNIKKLRTFDLNNMNIEECKNKCIELLRFTKRNDIEKLIQLLDESGYFHIPGSMKHHRYKGGLLIHSLDTFLKYLDVKKETQGWTKEQMNYYLPLESIIIVSLLHDLGKTEYLYFDERTKQPQRIEGKDGREHGYKSYQMIEKCGFKLNEMEKQAIIDHMGMNKINKISYEQSYGKHNKLSYGLYVADCRSACN